MKKYILKSWNRRPANNDILIAYLIEDSDGYVDFQVKSGKIRTWNRNSFFHNFELAPAPDQIWIKLNE